MELIARAVELAEVEFPGAPLAQAWRFASHAERQAVLCIVWSRHALSDWPAMPQEVIAALRKLVRGPPSQPLLGRPRVV